MKREYVRPTWSSEEFYLCQQVVAACEIILDPGQIELTGDWSCAQQNGGGHWHGHGVTVKDDNQNGKLDWKEIVKYVGAADNGIQTGQGHQHHGVQVTTPGGTVTAPLS